MSLERNIWMHWLPVRWLPVIISTHLTALPCRLPMEKIKTVQKTQTLPCDPGRKLYEFSGILRNAHAKLLHVSTEFQPRYDEEIFKFHGYCAAARRFHAGLSGAEYVVELPQTKTVKEGCLYICRQKTMCRCCLALSPWKTATSSAMMAFMCRNTRYTLQSRFIRTHRKHRQKMWMRCAGKNAAVWKTDLRRVLRKFPWYMILRKQCSMWENRPISHKNRYQTAGGCLRWIFS